MDSSEVTLVNSVPESAPPAAPVVVAPPAQASPLVELVKSLDPSTADFVKLLTELLQKKPQNKAEALELYHQLTVKLGTWVVKDLPALEQKAILFGLWALEEVSKVSCWGRK